MDSRKERAVGPLKDRACVDEAKGLVGIAIGAPGVAEKRGVLQGFGVRLEDDVVLQTSGAPLNLMRSIPISVEEIEDLMNP